MKDGVNETMTTKDRMPVACFRCVSWTRNPDVKVDCVSYAARIGQCSGAYAVNLTTSADFHCQFFVAKDESAF